MQVVTEAPPDRGERAADEALLEARWEGLDEVGAASLAPGDLKLDDVLQPAKRRKETSWYSSSRKLRGAR